MREKLMDRHWSAVSCVCWQETESLTSQKGGGAGAPVKKPWLSEGSRWQALRVPYYCTPYSGWIKFPADSSSPGSPP